MCILNKIFSPRNGCRCEVFFMFRLGCSPLYCVFRQYAMLSNLRFPTFSPKFEFYSPLHLMDWRASFCVVLCSPITSFYRHLERLFAVSSRNVFTVLRSGELFATSRHLFATSRHLFASSTKIFAVSRRLFATIRPIATITLTYNGNRCKVYLT